MKFMEKGVCGYSPRKFLNDYMQNRAFLDYNVSSKKSLTLIQGSYFILKLWGTTKEKNYKFREWVHSLIINESKYLIFHPFNVPK